MVVIAGLIFSPDPIRRAKSLTPFKPPKSGTTALPSSATAKIGGSCCLSVNKGAIVLIKIPAAQIPIIGVPAVNNSRKVAPKLLKLISTS